MDEPTSIDLARAMLLLQALVLVPAVGVALSGALRARAVVGERLAEARSGWRARLALLALPILVAALAVAFATSVVGSALVAFPAFVLALGAALVALVPAPTDATLGTAGVRRGFHARAFEELEEWRLTGEHLRFRLFGEWTSVPCPPELHADVRARLLAACPERESPFS